MKSRILPVILIVMSVIAGMTASTLVKWHLDRSLPAPANRELLRIDGDDLIAEGRRFFQERKFHEALQRLESASKEEFSSISNSDLMTMIGNCHLELSQFREALAYHGKALEADPGNYRAHVNKGIVYRLQGKFDEAEECYSRALKQAPNYAELHASRGALAIHRRQYKRAIEYFKRAIELDPSLPVAHSNLSLAYAMVGKFEDADESLKQAVLQGYHQPEQVQQRIDRLRSISRSSTNAANNQP